MFQDPVCGMMVDEDTPYTVDFQNVTYYFCSPGCAEEFEENPEDYVETMQESYGE